MSDPKYKHVGSPVTKLIEECSELIQSLCKADRFGWFNYHPDRPHSNNLKEVRREMDDVVEACAELERKLMDIQREYYKHKETPKP